MPSFWKKLKGNRISRLVADLQTPPKRGGSLVVETGFPTSIIDLFVKNRDRLKKPSKTKHRFKEPATTATATDQSLPVRPSLVSDQDPPVSLSKLDVPSWSINEKNQETVAQESNFGFGVEETIAQKNPFVELKSNCCKDEGKEDKERANGVSLSLKKSIWLSILKGALIVVVAFYTKRFVMGITIGAFLLLLLEFVGNSVFRFLKPCEDAKRMLKDFSIFWVESKPDRAVDEGIKKKDMKGVFEGSISIGSKGSNKGEREVVFESIIEQELENSASRRPIQQDGSGVTPKEEIDQGEVGSFIMESCLDGVVRNESCHEIEVLEPNKGDSPGEYCKLQSWKVAIGGGEKEGKGSEMVNHDGKTKKEKKFWKIFMPKLISRKKKCKQGKERHESDCGHEVPTDCIEENTGGLDEEGKQEEDEQKLSLSFDEVVNWEGKEFVSPEIHSNHNERLQSDNMTKSSRVVMKQGLNFNGLAVMGITLAGLIRSRILALLLTVICCLVFKMMRS